MCINAIAYLLDDPRPHLGADDLVSFDDGPVDCIAEQRILVLQCRRHRTESTRQDQMYIPSMK